MTNNVDKQLKELRGLDLQSWATSLWLVKRELKAKKADYWVLRVDTDDRLKTRLKKAVMGRVQGKEYHVEEYSFLNADQDGNVFTIDVAETDFRIIQSEIAKGLDNGKATTYDDLLGSWAYVIQLTRNGESLYALRKISKMTKAKKVRSAASFIFKDQMLIDLDDEEVFTVDTEIDLFAYDGTVFITNKKEFESALNFRKGMEANRDTVLAEFESLGIFNDVEPIRRIVGSNLHLLRRISAVHKSAYYRDTTFFQNLLNMNTTESWGLVIENNRIVVTEKNVDLVLTLFNNSRLKSPINYEVFDAQVKRKVV